MSPVLNVEGCRPLLGCVVVHHQLSGIVWSVLYLFVAFHLYILPSLFCNFLWWVDFVILLSQCFVCRRVSFKASLPRAILTDWLMTILCFLAELYPDYGKSNQLLVSRRVYPDYRKSTHYSALCFWQSCIRITGRALSSLFLAELYPDYGKSTQSLFLAELYPDYGKSTQLFVSRRVESGLREEHSVFVSGRVLSGLREEHAVFVSGRVVSGLREEHSALCFSQRCIRIRERALSSLFLAELYPDYGKSTQPFVSRRVVSGLREEHSALCFSQSWIRITRRALSLCFWQSFIRITGRALSSLFLAELYPNYGKNTLLFVFWQGCIRITGRALSPLFLAELYPDYGRSTQLRVRLEAGDALYLPSFWFHHLSQSQAGGRANAWKRQWYSFSISSFQSERRGSVTLIIDITSIFSFYI